VLRGAPPARCPQVQGELDKAMPALQAAEEALNVLTKKDMSELKAYAKPPALVELTLNAVMTVFRCAMQPAQCPGAVVMVFRCATQPAQ